MLISDGILQHEDRNIVPRDYTLLEAQELIVTKIWYTIQGEGPYAGCPAIFIRLAGCNRGIKSTMGCPWCDTAFQFDKGIVMPFSEILKQMLSLSESSVHPPIVVITGGEPMLQKNIVPFCNMIYRNEFKRIQIESNGDFLAEGWFEDDLCSHEIALVVSPKVTGNKYHKPRREVFEIVDAIKFLISADENSPYHSVPDCWLPRGNEEGAGIFLSPITVYKRAVREGEIASIFDSTLIDLEMTQANFKRAVQLAMYHGFSVSLQKHLFLGLE